MDRRFSLLAALLSAFFLFGIVPVKADAEGMSIPAMLTSAKSLSHAASCVTTHSGGLGIAKFWSPGSCVGSACSTESGSNFDSIFTSKDWQCLSFDETNRRCTSWGGLSDECGRGTELSFTCTSWRNSACVYWSGTCSGGIATASSWSCSSWNGPVCASWTAELSGGCATPSHTECVSWNGDYCAKWVNSLGGGCGGAASWSCSGFDDLCAGVSCSNYCDGSTFRYAGACDFGSCVYSSLDCFYGCNSSGCLPSPYNLYGIELNAPENDSLVFVGGSLEMNCTPLTGGALDGINLSFQFNSSAIAWLDIPPTDGESLYANSANPIIEAQNAFNYSLMVTATSPDYYNIRCALTNSTAQIFSKTVSLVVSPTPMPSPPPAPSQPEQTPPPEQQPPQGSSGSGSSGGFGGGFGGGGAGRKPPVSPTPLPSPTLAPLAPSPSAFPLFIDIRVPLQFEEGMQRIVVFVNGERAKGFLSLTDPDGRVFERRLGGDGSLEFFFATPGFWRIGFGNESVFVKVLEKTFPGNVSSVEAEAKEQRNSSFVGLSVFGFAPEYLGLLAALFLSLAFVLDKCFFSVLRVKKVFNNNKAEIIVSNRATDLNDLVLTDFVGGEASVSGFSEEPSNVRETISGSLLEWRKNFLKKGGEWRIAYNLSGNDVVRSAVEVEGFTAEGKKMHASG